MINKLEKLDKIKIFGILGAVLFIIADILLIVGGLRKATGGTLIYVIGLALLLLAILEISKRLKNESIVKYMFIFIILGLTGRLIFLIFIGKLIDVGSAFSSSSDLANWYFLLSLFAVLPRVFIIIGIIGYGILIVAFYFFKKVLDAIAKNLNVHLFKYVGILFFIGSILSIIFLGNFLIFMGNFLLMIAFFYIPEMALEKEKIPMVDSQIEYCTNCGNKLLPEQKFCPNCGTPKQK